MRRIIKSQKWAVAIFIVLILIGVVIVGVGLWDNYKNKLPPQNQQANQINQSSANESESIVEQTPNNITQTSDLKTNPIFGIPCQSDTHPIFTHDITDVDRISHIVPPGWATIEVKPHSFIFIDSNVVKVPIYSPVDADLVEGVYKNAKDNIDYDLHFQASCEVWFLINHVSDPVDKIRQALPSVPQTTTQDPPRLEDPIHFKAGDLIGYTTGVIQSHSFDFGVEHINHINQFVNMARYQRGGLGNRPLHAICPYELFSDDKKPGYYSKFGDEKIDPGTPCRSASQDTVGTIAGAWFPTKDGRDSDDPKIAIGLQTDGKLRLTGTSFQQFFISPSNPTYKQPEDVKQEYCYQEGNRIIFLKLVSDTEMQVFVNDSTTQCPNSFPLSGYTTYYR